MFTKTFFFDKRQAVDTLKKVSAKPRIVVYDDKLVFDEDLVLEDKYAKAEVPEVIHSFPSSSFTFGNIEDLEAFSSPTVIFTLNVDEDFNVTCELASCFV